MFRQLCLLAAAALVPCTGASDGCKPNAPCYSVDSIVNSASGVAGALTSNALVTLHGTGLSFSERAVTPADVRAGMLPTILPGTGVRVYFDGWPAQMYYAGPNQVNFLVPSNLRAAEVNFRLVRDSTAGPLLRVKLLEAAPALFQMDSQNVLASKLDWSLATREAPVRAGEWVILWGTGLGPVSPSTIFGTIPLEAALIDRFQDFRVLLDGAAVDRERVNYAGVAPGFSGLYQINVKLPANIGEHPEIRIAVASHISPPGLRLFAGPAVR